MHDEQSEHAHHFLHREMRVIEERACLMQFPLVNKLAARWDGILSQSHTAIHLHWHFESVPVDGRHFG
jgi:hypothetical protein